MPLPLVEDRPPIPPADLMLRVLTSFDAENIEGIRMSFDLEALDHLHCFERALASIGRSFSDFDRLLDFGCGCGRFVRHFGSLVGDVEIHGTDIDREMIDWCRENIAYGQYTVAPHEPPTAYPDHHFDLIINHSVFTHLNERHQDLWLAELQRITRPDAVLMLTIEGASSWNRTSEASERVGEDPEPWRAELESRGILFVSDDHFVGSTHPDFYHSTVHAPWYVFEHWTRFFDLAAYLPDGSATQDLLVMRRRADAAPQPRPIGHRAAPPAAPEVSIDSSAGRDRLSAAVAAGRRLMRREKPQSRTPAEPRDDGPDPDSNARELNMLRVGLYEQGNRISVIAAALREEIESLRAEKPP
jgi:SAM-dependent methyltransferase